MNRHERRAAARRSQTALGVSGAATPATLSANGRVHLQAGRVNDAQACCQRALAIEPDHADSLHLAGLLALNAGQSEQAVERFTRAIRQAPVPLLAIDDFEQSVALGGDALGKLRGRNVR